MSVFMSQGRVHDVFIKQTNVWHVFLRETHASSGVKDIFLFFLIAVFIKYFFLNILLFTTLRSLRFFLLLKEFSRLIIFIKYILIVKYY